MALSPVRLCASMSAGSADTIAFTRSNSPALIASMKAALLEVVSGMPRFYRGRRATAGWYGRAVEARARTSPAARMFGPAVFTAFVLAAAGAAAQPPSVFEQPLLGSTLT